MSERTNERTNERKWLLTHSIRAASQTSGEARGGQGFGAFKQEAGRTREGRRCESDQRVEGGIGGGGVEDGEVGEGE